MEQTTGMKILFSLFLGQPAKDGKELFYDYPAYFLYERVEKNKALPKEDKLVGVYGEFLWSAEIVDILEDEYMDVKAGDYKKLLRNFRKKCVRKIVEYIDPDYPNETHTTDIISFDDISAFLQLIAKNKIRKDMQMRENEIIVKEMANAVCRKNFLVDLEEHDDSYIVSKGGYDKVDFYNPKVPLSPYFEQLEKENWKKHVQPEFHNYIDAIDLTTFKKLLKDPMGRHFLPIGWQGEFLLRHRRRNYVGASRRAGKTFLGAGYLAGRQLMLPMQTIIYIVPTLKNHARPAWRALSHYFGDCKEFKMNKSDFSIVNTVTKSEMYFITAERGDSVRGNAANLLIVDEAAFIDEQIYETASALVRTTRGMVYCISTVNPDTPKNWFYYNLIDAEISGMDEASTRFARRIDLDHNPFIPDDEKADIKENGKRNPDLFNAEYMVSFMDKDSFDLSKFWIIDEEATELMIEGRWNTKRRGEGLSKEVKSMYSRFIISYDGAKRKDQPGVSVRGVRNGGMDLIMCGYMEGYEYRSQVDLIYYIYEMLGGQKKCEIIMDYGGAGIAVEEIFRKTKDLYPVCIQAVGGTYEEKDSYVWKVGKDLMLSKLKSAMSMGTIKGYSFQNLLRLEFETYVEDGSRNTKIKNHWDIISSMYHAVWFAEKFGYLEKEEVTVVEDRINGEYEEYNNPELGFQMLEPSPYERIEKFGY